jgi:hypothetical protein
MHFALALAIAVSFWGARGVTVPCQPTAVPGSDAALQSEWHGYAFTEPMATADGCRILLSRYGSALRHALPALYCADVVHETGHLAGLGHTPTGLMAEELDEGDEPYDCVRWRAFARRHGIPLRR